MYNPVVGHVHVTHDVVFDEGAKWSWDDSAVHQGGDGGVFNVEYDVPDHHQPGAQEQLVDGATGEGPSFTGPTPGGAASPRTPILDGAESTPVLPPVEFVTPLVDWEDVVDADHDEDAPVRFRAVNNVLGATSPPRLARTCSRRR
jgi:hypothetical protein